MTRFDFLRRCGWFSGLCALAMVTATADARLLFRNGLEAPVIQPLFPKVAGEFVLPDEPAANQLAWVLGELAKPSTSISDIEARFSAGWLNSNDAVATQNFINSVRTSFPDGKIVDIVSITPMRVFVLVQGQDENRRTGFFSVSAAYSGDNRIAGFGVTPNSGDLQYAEDKVLTMSQAIDKFATLAADVGLLVAYIDDDNQCQPIHSRNPDTLLATGSIFKAFVMGGLADAVQAGTLDPQQSVPLVESERVYAGSVINREPNGTLFSLQDLAVMMMGESDNTATDLVHEVTGRATIDAYVARSGVADPSVLSPMLSVNEQFHLFFSFDLATANGYLNDTEANQLAFINDSIVPLGRVSAFPFNNDSLFTMGSWRASPMDLCQNLATLRSYPAGSEAIQLVDRVMGAQVAQSRVRNKWDRAWYKGGSLVSGVSGYKVLTHHWLLEREGSPPFVVVGMTNDPNGGIDDNLGIFRVQSVLARILELTAEGP